FLSSASVVPVLTAHPTEVQRQSTLAIHREIANLLPELDRSSAGLKQKRQQQRIVALITTMWKTRLLRQHTLTVLDEIDNALAYYPHTFLKAIPELYHDLGQLLADDEATDDQNPLPAFLRMGSWIGGDRDGNPNVDSSTLEQALLRQSSVALSHYLREVKALGTELSISELLAPASDALMALSAATQDSSPHRVDEHYRRACIHIYARLAATSVALTGRNLATRHTYTAAAYQNAAEFQHDLDVIAKSLAYSHAAEISHLRLRSLLQTVAVFGFHLATIDLRQSSDVHERVITELFSAA